MGAEIEVMAAVVSGCQQALAADIMAGVQAAEAAVEAAATGDELVVVVLVATVMAIESTTDVRRHAAVSAAGR